MDPNQDSAQDQTTSWHGGAPVPQQAGLVQYTYAPTLYAHPGHVQQQVYLQEQPTQFSGVPAYTHHGIIYYAQAVPQNLSALQVPMYTPQNVASVSSYASQQYHALQPHHVLLTESMVAGPTQSPSARGNPWFRGDRANVTSVPEPSTGAIWASSKLICLYKVGLKLLLIVYI